MAMFTDNGVIKPCECGAGCDKCEQTGTVRVEQSRWRVELDIGKARKLKKDMDWDIWNQESVNSLFRVEEMETFVNVLFLLIEDQAEARGITDEQFGARLGGGADKEAHDALIEAVRDFFSARGAVELATAVDKQAEQVDRAHRKAAEKISEKADGLAARIDARMNEEIDRALADGSMSGGSPEHSE